MSSRRKRKHVDTAAEPAPADAESSAAEDTHKAECTARIATLTAEIAQIESGEHAEFQNKCCIFEQEKHTALQQAEQTKKDKLANIESLFEYEIQASEDIYQGKMKEQKKRMLEEWRARLKKAEDEAEGKPVVEGETELQQELLE